MLCWVLYFFFICVCILAWIVRLLDADGFCLLPELLDPCASVFTLGGWGKQLGHLSPTVKHLPTSPLITSQTHSNILYGPFHHGVAFDSDRVGGGCEGSTLGIDCDL